eukprot:jgi/Hompol1/2272/HPOL_002151-RA
MAPPVSGLDCVLLLEVDNEVAISRSAGLRVDPITDKVYHLELDPPPKNVPGTFERLVPVEDESKSRAQLQYQLAAFEEEEEPLKEWLSRFKTLRTVDASHTSEKTVEIAQGYIREIIEANEQSLRERQSTLKLLDEQGEGHSTAAPNSDVQGNATGEEADTPTEMRSEEDKERKASLRREQESILRFFFETKTSFRKFLERPDLKQDLVDTFQAEYNAIEDDL